mmetsp:Transcript_38062/g.67977  ORF Transcript_38062/g.67977 Transcript_38062/m.67977 type:complete len:97 (+) Transcript_38062:473-763(+)
MDGIEVHPSKLLESKWFSFERFGPKKERKEKCILDVNLRYANVCAHSLKQASKLGQYQFGGLIICMVWGLNAEQHVGGNDRWLTSTPLQTCRTFSV